MKQSLADDSVVRILVITHLRSIFLAVQYNLVVLTLKFSECLYYIILANIFQEYLSFRLAQTLKTHLPNVWSCDIIESSFTQTTSMSYDILINNLVNGETVTVTRPDGTSYTEPRPPNRTALAAAKAIQNLQGQLNFGTAAIAQLTQERNELWELCDKVQQENKRLQDEVNTKTSTNTSANGSTSSSASG